MAGEHLPGDCPQRRRTAVKSSGPTRPACPVGPITCISSDLIRQLVLVSEAEPEGGARFSPPSWDRGPPSGGTETRYDPGPEDYSSEGRALGISQAARQREPSLQDDGLQPRQLLPVQGAVRQRGRVGLAGDQPP